MNLRQTAIGKLQQCYIRLGMELGSALEMYCLDQGHYPRDLAELQSKHYLGAVPGCPADGRAYIYHLDSPGQHFRLTCGSHAHWLAWTLEGGPIRRHNPYYLSESGLHYDP